MVIGDSPMPYRRKPQAARRNQRCYANQSGIVGSSIPVTRKPVQRHALFGAGSILRERCHLKLLLFDKASERQGHRAAKLQFEDALFLEQRDAAGLRHLIKGTRRNLPLMGEACGQPRVDGQPHWSVASRLHAGKPLLRDLTDGPQALQVELAAKPVPFPIGFVHRGQPQREIQLIDRHTAFADEALAFPLQLAPNEWVGKQKYQEPF